MTAKPPVCRYTSLNGTGMEIHDARERIQVVLNGEPPRGVKASLRHKGFRRQGDNIWDAPATTMKIAAAQEIGGRFFEQEQ